VILRPRSLSVGKESGAVAGCPEGELVFEVASTVAGVSTRTLLILAAITGLAILVAFAVQVTILAN
jgi:hypothetical protein